MVDRRAELEAWQAAQDRARAAYFESVTLWCSRCHKRRTSHVSGKCSRCRR